MITLHYSPWLEGAILAKTTYIQPQYYQTADKFKWNYLDTSPVLLNH